MSANSPLDGNGYGGGGKHKDLAGSIVWTPIPMLTWFLPIFGHMGIVNSNGVLRDFAGPYYVSTDNMAFGRPTKYFKLESELMTGGFPALDLAIAEASEEYKKRNHNLLCDNCHDFVALALHKVNYRDSKWNTLKLAFTLFFFGKFISFATFLQSWLPSLIIAALIFGFCYIY